jgi:hypothetical protein
MFVQIMYVSTLRTRTTFAILSQFTLHTVQDVIIRKQKYVIHIPTKDTFIYILCRHLNFTLTTILFRPATQCLTM